MLTYKYLIAQPDGRAEWICRDEILVDCQFDSTTVVETHRITISPCTIQKQGFSWPFEMMDSERVPLAHTICQTNSSTHS